VTEGAMGTPYYLSPEVCTQAKYSFASDTWSLGVILYELAVLRVPFEASSYPVLVEKIKRGPPPSLPLRFSGELRLLCRELFRHDPSDRPLTADIIARPIIQREVSRMLEAQASEGTGSRPESACKSAHDSQSTKASDTESVEFTEPSLQHEGRLKVDSGRKPGQTQRLGTTQSTLWATPSRPSGATPSRSSSATPCDTPNRSPRNESSMRMRGPDAAASSPTDAESRLVCPKPMSGAVSRSPSESGLRRELTIARAPRAITVAAAAGKPSQLPLTMNRPSTGPSGLRQSLSRAGTSSATFTAGRPAQTPAVRPSHSSGDGGSILDPAFCLNATGLQRVSSSPSLANGTFNRRAMPPLIPRARGDFCSSRSGCRNRPHAARESHPAQGVPA